MKSEFQVKLPKVGLMDLLEFESYMTNTISNKMRGDFRKMDDMLVEVFSKQVGTKAHPPLRSLGRMSVRTVKEKFA